MDVRVKLLEGFGFKISKYDGQEISKTKNAAIKIKEAKGGVVFFFILGNS